MISHPEEGAEFLHVGDGGQTSYGNEEPIHQSEESYSKFICKLRIFSPCLDLRWVLGKFWLDFPSYYFQVGVLSFGRKCRFLRGGQILSPITDLVKRALLVTCFVFSSLTLRPSEKGPWMETGFQIPLCILRQSLISQRYQKRKCQIIQKR